MIGMGTRSPKWAEITLKLAAAYNVVWGTAVVLFPLVIFEWTQIELPRYPQIWQCVGMIVGVYGVGYWIASRNPFRHWPIVLVGLLGKIFGPIGFVTAAMNGDLPWRWGLTILTNDLIWWLPFAAILYQAFRHHANTAEGNAAFSLDEALRVPRSHRGASLEEISANRPTLVVFLRHSGCTFCKTRLASLEDARDEVRRREVNLVIVHMGSPMEGTMLLRRHDLHCDHHFSDPQCKLYRAFSVERGTLGQLLSLRVIRSGIRAWFKGHGIGRMRGDGFRLSGAFVLFRGRIHGRHLARTADDHCDVIALLNDATESIDLSELKPSPQHAMVT